MAGVWRRSNAYTGRGQGKAAVFASTLMSSIRSARVLRFVFHNSLLLLAGTAAALVWANIDLPGYEQAAQPLHFWINDVGMVFFFALAAKEVFEATLPDGALASPARAISPLAAAVGGMLTPAAIYVLLV